jgi:hypothetical protein
MLFDETKNDFLFNIVSPNIIFFARRCSCVPLCAAMCRCVPLRLQLWITAIGSTTPFQMSHNSVILHLFILEFRLATMVRS